MQIIHSGFDSIYFSIQGALSPVARKRYERLKDQAIQQKSDHSFHVDGSTNRYRIQGNGKTGGYTHLINTGHVGSVIAFKKSLSRTEHNGFAEISSACLLAHGWENAIAQTLGHVKTLGFHVVEISLNRADYCMDFLDAPIDIDPRDFIAHSRVKKTAYHESGRVLDHMQKRSVAQSDHVKSLTLGKMPGRQIIVYDKRAEVIEKRKLYWFDAWGVDRADNTRTVHRVEVRAARDHLRKYNIRTLDDFKRHIGLVLTDAVRAIRWVRRPATDANVTRSPLHPVWEAVQTHMDNALAPYTAPLTAEVITECMRESKCHEYKQQFTGILGGYLGCTGVVYEEMPNVMQALIGEVSDSLKSEAQPPMMKSYHRAREKWD